MATQTKSQAGLVSKSAKRTLSDTRGAKSRKGDNPTRHDTFFIRAGQVNASFASGANTFVHLLTVGPEAFANNSSGTSKLINFRVSFIGGANNLDFTNLKVQKVAFNSGGNSYGAADSTSGAGNNSVAVAPATAFYDQAQTAADHRYTGGSGSVVQVIRNVDSTDTQLEVKPCDVIMLTLTMTGFTGTVTGAYDIALEFTELSI